MKYILFILFLPLIAFSQHIAENKIDEFTGNTIIRVICSKGKYFRTNDKITKGMFKYAYISSRYVLSKDKHSQIFDIIFGLQSLDVGTCLSEYDGKAILLFEDSTTLELKQSSKTDCFNTYSGLPGYYTCTKENIEYCAKNKLSKFRIYTTSGYIDYEVKDDKKEMIQKHFAMLLDEVNKV